MEQENIPFLEFRHDVPHSKFRLGTLDKILDLPIEIYLMYSVYFRFRQADVFHIKSKEGTVSPLLSTMLRKYVFYH